MNPNSLRFLLAKVFARALIGFVSLVASIYFVLVVSDSAVKVLLHAFGLEIPNPIDWMPRLLHPW
jgi:hypothetical protein